MSERLVSISMCLACPYFLEGGAGKDCLLCEKHFDDSFDGGDIPDWCTLQKADELPEWLIDAIKNRINWWVNHTVMKAPELREEIADGVRHIDALKCVLSLRKPKETKE